MFKQMTVVLLLAVVVVGCNTNRQELVKEVVKTPDQQVLEDRQVVLSTPADPQTEQTAQEWARIAADRERQQMEFQLRQQELNAIRADQWNRQAQQVREDEARAEWLKDQQKREVVREAGYTFRSLGNQVLYNRSQRSR